MSEIKPCPRCGSTRGKVVLTGVRKCYAHLFCPVCRLEGVKYPYPDEGGEAAGLALRLAASHWGRKEKGGKK